MMRYFIILIGLMLTINGYNQFPPAAGMIGSTAIHKDSNIIVNWASQVINFTVGQENISVPQSPLASFGQAINALGMVEGNSTDVVSLGDSGSIILSFPFPISNGPGPDFAVFENGFSDNFLELAFVEVSTNGIDFVRFPAVSNTSSATQNGSFGSTDPTLINNLAGKYRQGFGTPFDLEELSNSSSINIDSINYVKIIDVIGSVDPTYASYDSNGNIINDPFPTEFSSCGFDLDGVGVIYQNNPLNIKTSTDLNFTAFPNPFETEISLFLNESTTLAYNIYDFQGRLIINGTLNYPYKLNLEYIDSGIYFLELKGEDTKGLKKIIKA